MKQIHKTGTSQANHSSVSDVLMSLSKDSRDARPSADHRQELVAASAVISPRFVDSRLKQFSCR